MAFQTLQESLHSVERFQTLCLSVDITFTMSTLLDYIIMLLGISTPELHTVYM